tara:strand:- start:673 stop:984 length:312 start_codon:yes stop_codon:yes gene_type:complete
MSIITNIYGEVIDKKGEEKIERIFNNTESTEEELKLISGKIRCACGKIISVSGLKSHISSSVIHKKRMEKIGCADIYIHPFRPYSRLQKCIEIFHEKTIVNFD